MIYFNSDYTEGAHPRIIQRLEETNWEQTPGYGADRYCRHAAELIRKECGSDSAAVHFLVGGTQTNLTVIAAALRPHQCVMAAVTGHVSIHETGAIEATGHKVMELPGEDGKLTAKQIREAAEGHWNDDSHEHIAQPKLVYLSNPTELGTVYTRRELEEIRDVCREKGLYLFLDGARLGYGMAAPGNDLNLKILTDCCDVFYLGGTKMGLLFGEAVVITNDALKEDFRYLIKQRGGMLAKGRLLGLQFEAVMEDGLYWELGRHGTEQALRIREALRYKGVPFLIDSPTNQQFPIFHNKVLEQLEEKYVFDYQKAMDASHSAVRICTCWGTKTERVDDLIRDIEQLWIVN